MSDGREAAPVSARGQTPREHYVEQRRPLGFERPGIQLLCLFASWVTPFIFAAMALKWSPNAAISVACILFILILSIMMVGAFDPRSRPLLNTWVGVAMKILAVFHAVAALKLSHTFSGQDVEKGLPELLLHGRWLIVVGLWGLAVMVYFAGDAKYRRARERWKDRS